MVMIEYPELVDQVHAEYFRVGATIATTNTYPVLQDRLDTNGWNMQLNWSGNKNKLKIRLHGSVVLNLQLTDQSPLRKNMDTALSLLLILKNLIPPTLLR